MPEMSDSYPVANYVGFDGGGLRKDWIEERIEVCRVWQEGTKEKYFSFISSRDNKRVSESTLVSTLTPKRIHSD